MVFPVIMYGCWELDHKEVWVPKYRCFQIVVLEKTLESPLDCKEIKPFNPKGNQTQILEGLILKLKLQYVGHLMQRADSSVKDPDARKDWGHQEKGATEDEVVGWQHWLSGHELEQTLGDSEGQGSLACYSPFACCKVLDMATHSSILACKIPWTEEPGRLQSTGSQRFGHN